MIGRNSSLSQQEVVGENFNPGLGELGEFRRKGFRSRRQDAVLHRNRVSRSPALRSCRVGSCRRPPHLKCCAIQSEHSWPYPLPNC